MAKQPMLKGMVERIFGVMGVQVLSYEEGCTLARSEEYDPAERATRSLEEIHARLLKWIVDEYHTRPHPALDGLSPLEAWVEKTARFPVPPVASFDHIIRMTGRVIPRKISNVGVNYEGFLFASPAHDSKLLERLRIKGGVDRDWMIFVDDYNYGEVWVLDDIDGEWLTLENVDPEISVGVSRFQHRLIVKRAKELAAKRSCAVTTRELLDARRELEAEADAAVGNGKTMGRTARAARWHTQGLLFTALYGTAMASLGSPPPDLTAAREILAGASLQPALEAPASGDPGGSTDTDPHLHADETPAGHSVGGDDDGVEGGASVNQPLAPGATATDASTETNAAAASLPADRSVEEALDELIGDWG